MTRGSNTSAKAAAAAARVPSRPALVVPGDRPSATLKGLAAAPGIAIDVVQIKDSEIPVPDGDLEPSEVEAETARFRQAIARAREDLTFLRATAAEEMGEEPAKILDTQLLFLEDTAVVDPVIDGIHRERKPAAYLLQRNVSRLVGKADSEYLRERANVFRDIERRVIRYLLGIGLDMRAARHGVLMARELAPSDLLDRAGIAGFATEGGGVTSHAAIIARSKGVPAVVAVKKLMSSVEVGDVAVVDGLAGEVVINPGPAVLAGYERRQEELLAFESGLAALRDLPAVTTDGRRIDLAANIESPADVDRVLECGADGIGLYRTEFFYLDRARIPDEEEQYRAYRAVAERLNPRPVIIRTMDIGGDKVTCYLSADAETNPYFGWRGIRFSLEHRGAFRDQLRAIYRASAHGRIKLMLPMVTEIEELRAARALVGEVVADLDRARVGRSEQVEFGMMVETPSAVLMADVFAREVDFFSVGSNDLIQYMLAVDRTNPKEADLYQPLHPAVLRGLKAVVTAARAEKIWVGICGEMAAEPLGAALLIGLGFDELSVSPYLVPEVKTVVRSVAYAEAQAVAEQAVNLDSASAVRALALSRLGKLLPEWLLP